MPNIYTRVHNKKETETSWALSNPVLLDGEMILVETSEGVRIKVGDGVTHYIDLPYVSGVEDNGTDEGGNSGVEATLNADDLGLIQDASTGYVYPTYKGIKSSKGIPLSSGGSGGGSATPSTIFRLRSATEATSFSVGYNSPAQIAYTFTSLDSYDNSSTGNGTASYYINGSLILNTAIPQGTTSFECGKYLNVGENEVTVYVTDAENNMRSLTWNITCIEIKLTSTFDYTIAYSGDVTFKYTAYGDAEKVIHFVLNGVEQETATVASSGRQNTAVFSDLPYGLNTLEVYALSTISGSVIESNHLVYDIIVITDESVDPVISINNRDTEVSQGELVDISYIAYDPLATESTVSLDIYYIKDGQEALYKHESRNIDRSLQHWTTRDYPVGTVRFSISLRDVSRSLTVEVSEDTLPIEPTTNDLELHLTSANRSNSELDPAVWMYGDTVTTEFNNVNWASSGWINDSNGDTALHLEGGSTAVIKFKPFSTDLRVLGKTIEFEFTVRDVNNREANVISCMSGGIGLEITADSATLYSNLSSVGSSFHHDSKIRVAFVIESRSEYRLMSLYLDGVLTRSVQYVATDNFQQIEPVDITVGSNECSVDLYTIRSYSTALSQEELLNNRICDITDIIERNELYEGNDLYDDAHNLLYEKVKKKNHVMTITGSLPSYKGDKKSVVVTFENIDDSSLNFKEKPCTIDVQGTSSQWYVRKNYKLKFKEELVHMKGMIPSKVFCTKADYAEATSTHNTQNANIVETLYSDLTPAQEVDSRCRTTITGYPIVIYHKETPTSTPVFLGKYNFNYDKGSEGVFGFTEDYDVECWEFCNNDKVCNFVDPLPDDFSMTDSDGNEVGWGEHFERRYPDDDMWENNEAIARFRQVHDWIHSTSSYDLSDPETLSKYRSEFEERFNLHKTLIYYVYTFFMLMVDQRAKNMFFTYWGLTGKWEPWFYDNDTCLGINNEGHLIFDYYHEDTDLMPDGTKVYNGQDSILWTKFMVAYAEEIKETYKSLRSDKKLTREVLRTNFVTNGSDQWSASIYNEDSDYKYLSMLRENGDATNVPQIRGTGEHHLDYFLDGRFNYYDSKCFAGDYVDDTIVLRINTPTTEVSVLPNANITVTPFSSMYAGVRYRANGTLQQKRVMAGDSYTFISPSDSFNDTETAIYGASQLSSIGDLAPLYCNYCDVSKATRLVELKVGSEDPTYESRLATLSLGTNRLLRKLDIRNCSSLTKPVDLTGCPSIKEVYAEGSSITSLELADSGYLRVVHLPGTITTLTIKNQEFLEDFTMTSYENLTELNLENSIGLPLTDILLNSSSLNRVRMVKVRWSCTEEELSSVYERLLSCGGIDETGSNIARSVVSGIVEVPSISEELLRKINRDFPELMLSVDGTILCTVSYYNSNGTLLHVTTVEQGTTAPDPVLEGTIDTPVLEATDKYSYAYKGWNDSLENIQKSKSFVATYEVSYNVRFFVGESIVYSEYVGKGGSVKDPITSGKITTPTLESTPEFSYEFSEWEGSLENVTDYRDIRAVFTETRRSYTVSFYNGDILLPGSKVLEYGSDVTYDGEIPQKTEVEFPQDYTFLGWSPELGTVTGDISYYAQYSDSDHILDDWSTVSANVANGTYKELYPLGILQRVPITYSDGTTEVLDAELVGYDHDDLSDGSGKAGLTFVCKNVLNNTHSIGESSRVGWVDSDLRKYLSESILPALPESLREVILPVTKKTTLGGGTTDVTAFVETEDKLWVPSLVEMVPEYLNESGYSLEGETYSHMIGSTEEENRLRRIRTFTDGYACKYWTRSPQLYSLEVYWVILRNGGLSSLYTASSSQYTVFGFCVGVTPNPET